MSIVECSAEMISLCILLLYPDDAVPGLEYLSQLPEDRSKLFTVLFG